MVEAYHKTLFDLLQWKVLGLPSVQCIGVTSMPVFAVASSLDDTLFCVIRLSKVVLRFAQMASLASLCS